MGVGSPQPRAILLVGFMGTGKSAVGRALAERLGRPFVDVDALVEAASGRSIAELFAGVGEAAFRDAESAAAAAAVRVPGAVIACGGGILERTANVDLLLGAGVLVCLAARLEVILARVGDASGRPMLAGAVGPRERVAGLLAAREPRYALAGVRIDTSDLTVAEVVERICAELPSLCPERPTTSSSDGTS